MAALKCTVAKFAAGLHRHADALDVKCNDFRPFLGAEEPAKKRWKRK